MHTTTGQALCGAQGEGVVIPSLRAPPCRAVVSTPQLLESIGCANSVSLHLDVAKCDRAVCGRSQ